MFCVLSSSLSAPCQAVSAGIRYSGVLRGKNKEKRRHLRAFLQRAPRTNPILHSSRRAPHTFKELLSYFQRSTRWDMEKYCDSRVFPTFGGLKNDVSHFLRSCFRIPLSKHYLSVRVFATVAYLFACEHEMNKEFLLSQGRSSRPRNLWGDLQRFTTLSPEKQGKFFRAFWCRSENAC